MLDLGTLGVRVQANTGDTVSRLDEVRNSLENVQSTAGEMSATVKSSSASITDSVGDMSGALTTGISAATKAASGDISGFVSSTLGMLGQFTPAAALATTAIGGISSLIGNYQQQLNGFIEANKTKLYEFAGYADEIATNSIVTGLSTDFVQLYSTMAGITDVDWSTIEKAIKTLNEEIGKAITGDEGAIAKFKALNIAIYGEDGEVLPTETIWDNAIKAIQAIPDEATRTAAAIEIFGKDAAFSLKPLIESENAARANLKDLANRFHLLATDKELGLGTAVKDMEDLRDAAKEALEYTEGIRIAGATETGLQSEADYIAGKNAYLHGEITMAELVDLQNKYLEEKVKLDNIEKEIAEYEAEEERREALAEDYERYKQGNFLKQIGASAEYFADSITPGPGWLQSVFGWTGLFNKNGDEYYTPIDGETDLRLNSIEDTYRFVNPLRFAAGDYSDEALSVLLNVANRSGVDLSGLDTDWVSDMRTDLSDVSDGILTMQEYEAGLLDIFSRLNNEEWDTGTTFEEGSAENVEVQNNGTYIAEQNNYYNSNVGYDEIVN